MLVAFRLFFVGLPRIVPGAGIIFSVKRAGASSFSLALDKGRFAKCDDGAVIHGVIEYGASEHKTISESHRNADGNSVAHVAQHATGSGTVKINRVANAGVERGIT